MRRDFRWLDIWELGRIGHFIIGLPCNGGFFHICTECVSCCGVGSLKKPKFSINVKHAGVYFTQTITDHMAENPKAGTPSDDRQNLRYFYGSLTKTILALWQSITGGADWDQMARPMIHEVSPMLGLAFCAYIAFAILALMNVVTGVFVQTALQSAQHEEDSFLTDQIISLFQMAKGDKSARITLDEIQQKVNDPAAAKEWKSINVSADEATYLFDLLDIDQSGDVYFEEPWG
ncbi:unnamed protein product, partial [Prorocentrum cordatum]